MSGDAGVQTENPLRQEVPVALSGGRLGTEIKNPGGEFNLGNVFSEDAAYLGGDKFTRVYFRTASGNMYLIMDEPRVSGTGAAMVNARESRVNGNGQFWGRPMEPDKVSGLKIVVGKPFDYGWGHTTEITEIVATNNRIYQQEALTGMTGGKTNHIIEDFKAMAVAPNQPQPRTP